jgi:hypothetical protein
MKLPLTLVLASMFSLSAFAETTFESAMIDELDPFGANINEVLLENDFLNAESRVEEKAIQIPMAPCFRDTCPVYIEVSKSTQRATLRINGELVFDRSGSLKNGDLRATTGIGPTKSDPVNRATKNWDNNPSAPLRSYSRYTSSKYPGGNWIGPDGKGYGNMPFVVFFSGGLGIHGTTGSATTGNISKLGTVPLSHGCVRIHPLNAKVFNEAVATYGRANTWIYVHP